MNHADPCFRADAARSSSAGASIRLNRVDELIDDLARGRMVVLVDDEDRENEGDLVIAAEHADTDAVNFMARHARGLICLALTQERCEELGLPLMVRRNQSALETNFTVSIDAARGITTGVSAVDRATTIRTAVNPASRPCDLVQPGHVFPLMARPGGVLARAGHTEAATDLARLARLRPAAVICEIMRDDGEMARLPDLVAFASDHGLKIGSIAEVISYRLKQGSLVRRTAERRVDTSQGLFVGTVFEDLCTGGSHIALSRGRLDSGDEVLVRVNESTVSMWDLLSERDRGGGWTVIDALRAIREFGSGVLVLLNCHRPPEMPAAGAPSGPSKGKQSAAMRDYGIGAQILKALGVTRMRLLTSPRKMPNMNGFGLQVVGYLLPGMVPGGSGKTTRL